MKYTNSQIKKMKLQEDKRIAFFENIRYNEAVFLKSYFGKILLESRNLLNKNKV